MKDRVNTYLAVFIITVAGAGASLLIIHLSTSNNLSATFGGSESGYSSLQQSILK